MKDTLWVFRNIGFLAGIFYIWHSIVRMFKRFLNNLSRKRFPLTFEDLTDEDAQMTAWAAGLTGWEDGTREDLNQAWNDWVKNETFH
jgi:hypothetical protein